MTSLSGGSFRECRRPIRFASIAEDVREKTVEQAAQELHRHRESLRQQIRATDDEMDRLEHEIEQVFNLYFGPPSRRRRKIRALGSRSKTSRVYTSRVSNFYSTRRSNIFARPGITFHERVY